MPLLSPSLPQGDTGEKGEMGDEGISGEIGMEVSICTYRYVYLHTLS